MNVRIIKRRTPSREDLYTGVVKLTVSDETVIIIHAEDGFQEKLPRAGLTIATDHDGGTW